MGAAEEVAETKSIALLVSGSPKGVSAALVQKLLSKCSFVLAVDSGAEILLNVQSVPDLLLGDFDSIDQNALDTLSARGAEIEKYDAYKDATDTELALKALSERGYTSIIATNVLGGRIDHELASLGNFAAAAQAGANVTIVDEDEICVFLSAENGLQNLQLDFTDGGSSYISLVPWGGTAEVSVSGVEWELKRATLCPSSSLGVSNEPRSELVDITVFSGTVIVVFEA